MSAENSGRLSNTIVLCNLFHLSRVVVFSAVPITLHLHYLEYRRYFDALPPYQTTPPLVPIYPYFIVFPAIVLIIFELETLRRFWMNTTSSYEALTISLFMFEGALLYFAPVLYVGGELYRILSTLELMVLFLSVFILGLFEMVLIMKKRFTPGPSLLSDMKVALNSKLAMKGRIVCLWI